MSVRTVVHTHFAVADSRLGADANDRQRFVWSELDRPVEIVAADPAPNLAAVNVPVVGGVEVVAFAIVVVVADEDVVAVVAAGVVGVAVVANECYC